MPGVAPARDFPEIESAKMPLSRISLIVLTWVALAAPARSATVTTVDTGNSNVATLAFSGRIIRGDLGRLQEQAARLPEGLRIVLLLDSPGGSINEGIALGRFIHAARMTTVAIQGPGCHSACTFLFLAGRDYQTDRPSRIMMQGARIGFHQGRFQHILEKDYTAEDVSSAAGQAQGWIAQINAYFNEIKADHEFLTLVLSSPTRRLTYLNVIDALRLGIYVMDPMSKKLLTPDQFKQQTTQR